ncbi:MAG: TPM domain-containing protein [bacterium]
MKIRFSLLFAIALVTAIASTALSVNYPEPTGYITDTAGALDLETKQKLIPILQSLHEKTTAQVGVAVIDTLDGVPIEEYAVKLFSKWKIGNKEKDNGVLLLVALNDRKMRIEVGYGLEGAIPDAKAGEIIDDIIKPKFKAGDINGGVTAGVEAIVAEIADEYSVNPVDVGMATGTAFAEQTGVPVPDPPSPTFDNPFIDFFMNAGFIIFFIGFIIIAVILGSISKRRRGGGGGYFYSSDALGGANNDSSYDSRHDLDCGSDSSDSFDGGDSGGGGASGDW